ncbi:ATP-binding protein [Nitratidesulfovibrio sp.]|uniref:hybrid sensor histidine kinase/response regulator n=1 Tax=Nitratidesulfovibrio sp. TaxID=2802297 RepID=UPI0033417F21
MTAQPYSAPVPPPSSAFLRYAENAPGALAVFDAHNRLTYANRAFRETLLTFPSGSRGGCDDADDARLRNLPLPASFATALAGGLALARQEGHEQHFSWQEADDEEPGRRWCRIVPAGTSAGSSAGAAACQAACQAAGLVGTCCAPDGAGQDAGKPSGVMSDGVMPTGAMIVEVHDTPAPERLKEALRAERIVRRQAEYLKQRGRELFFRVIDQLPVFVYMQRPDYRVAYANRKTTSFYGEAEGRLCYEVFCNRTSPCPTCPTFRVFETGEPEDWQFTDGKGRTFHIYDYPFEDENGAPLVMELGIDVTELKRVERELFQAQKMRAIGVLAGGIAHDLNNNLVPIIFNIDHALGKTGESGLSEPLGEALRAAYRAADLVEQVLDYSRQQNLNRAPLRLVPLAQENLELLQASLPRNVELRVGYATDKDCIQANPSQIQQLLLNLCRNGVQAMPAGGTLTVTLSHALIQPLRHNTHPGVQPGEYVVLRVTDTGHGIERERLEQIFEPFHTTKRNTGGTGMGLAVVHAIVTSSGGHIFVDSMVQVGTTFTVYLPLYQPGTTPSRRAVTMGVSQDAPYGMADGLRDGGTRGAADGGLGVPPTGSAAGGMDGGMDDETDGTGRNAPRRLLLVDDDKGASQAMQRVLRDAGFQVATADSGEAGLHAYRDGGPGYNLVVADQSMPGMTGIAMARRILQHDRAARIVICTGHVAPELEAEAQAAGIAGFLMKPMTPGTLIENIRRLCGAARG